MSKISHITVCLVFITISIVAQDQKTPLFWYEKGEQALGKKEYITARAHLSECLRLDPRYADAYRLRAIANERLGEKQRALTDYNIYVDLKPDDPEAVFSRGVLRFDAEQYLPARQDFLKLLKLPKGETNTVYFSQEKYDDTGGKVFTANHGSKDHVYNYLGVIETKLKRFDQAIVWLDSAVKISPANASYIVNRGLARLAKKDNEGARSDFNEALRQDPGNALALYNLSIVKTSEGESTTSEQLLSEAIAKNKNLPYPRAERAYQRMQKNDLTGALEDYDEVVKMEPKDHENYLNRGLVKEKMKNFQGALEDFSKAIELDEKDARSWLSRGNIMSKLLRWKSALEDYTVAIHHDGSYGLAYYNRAIANQNSGNTKEACEDIKAAERLNVKIDGKVREKICK